MGHGAVPRRPPRKPRVTLPADLPGGVLPPDGLSARMRTDSLTPLTLARIASCGDGRLIGEDRPLDGISTDSRSLPPGALFAAIRGDRFDGHEFADDAAARGAIALLVERFLPIALPQVVVEDTLRALTACARAHRRRFSGPLIAVTGSNGKTTTKEMIGAILSRRGPSLITKGNLNNHLGVPLTLLRLRDEHQSAVIEMGANHRGEIAHLASIAEPGVGLVTNAGAAHLEGFGSLEGVAAAKGEIFAALPPTGIAVINADDRFAASWRSTAAARSVLTFGVEEPADFTARDIQSSVGAGAPMIDFDLVSPVGTARARLGLAGLHNLRNALGAAAASHAAGAGLEDIVQGLADVKAVRGRLEFKPAINGALLVDDSYNANPGSLKAGLDAFQAFAGLRWLVLGDMMELGPASAELHAEVGRYAKASGIVRLLAFGPQSRSAAEAFGEGGSWFADIDGLIADATRSLTRDVAVLVKGSRANRLERVTAALARADSEVS
jgi:UDP-N-acetylmuramoyl-tripeptide--D-alanyl-D-alanine ligase